MAQRSRKSTTFGKIVLQAGQQRKYHLENMATPIDKKGQQSFLKPPLNALELLRIYWFTLYVNRAVIDHNLQYTGILYINQLLPYYFLYLFVFFLFCLTWMFILSLPVFVFYFIVFTSCYSRSCYSFVMSFCKKINK